MSGIGSNHGANANDQGRDDKEQNVALSNLEVRGDLLLRLSQDPSRPVANILILGDWYGNMGPNQWQVHTAVPAGQNHPGVSNGNLALGDNGNAANLPAGEQNGGADQAPTNAQGEQQNGGANQAPGNAQGDQENEGAEQAQGNAQGNPQSPVLDQQDRRHVREGSQMRVRSVTPAPERLRLTYGNTQAGIDVAPVSRIANAPEQNGNAGLGEQALGLRLDRQYLEYQGPLGMRRVMTCQLPRNKIGANRYPGPFRGNRKVLNPVEKAKLQSFLDGQGVSLDGPINMDDVIRMRSPSSSPEVPLAQLRKRKRDAEPQEEDKLAEGIHRSTSTSSSLYMPTSPAYPDGTPSPEAPPTPKAPTIRNKIAGSGWNPWVVPDKRFPRAAAAFTKPPFPRQPPPAKTAPSNPPTPRKPGNPHPMVYWTNEEKARLIEAHADYSVDEIVELKILPKRTKCSIVSMSNRLKDQGYLIQKRGNWVPNPAKLFVVGGADVKDGDDGAKDGDSAKDEEQEQE
ncbi:hypothetical protein EJ04DRAFT_524321 [Polyplosphaeria fusca]|uniref:Uncharacterized protein n=1 Tax=Polyplosphaeria fusca TaxID=682080 RepID=A0A9P4V1X3_9PLEO|nr:hypothetical protein EJ04DRAFT_524321 [Polyplosphaeria fusca]